jgi:hypothetical protein
MIAGFVKVFVELVTVVTRIQRGLGNSTRVRNTPMVSILDDFLLFPTTAGIGSLRITDENFLLVNHSNSLCSSLNPVVKG